jgi:hypothetical protein
MAEIVTAATHSLAEPRHSAYRATAPVRAFPLAGQSSLQVAQTSRLTHTHANPVEMLTIASGDRDNNTSVDAYRRLPVRCALDYSIVDAHAD